MKVLLIKMTSMGDIVHTFPALSDAGKNIPAIQFDWVVDAAFKDLPTWHPLVNKIIPIGLRQWRKNPLAAFKSQALKNAIKQIRLEEYDFIIDAQGLLKSKIIACFGRGLRCGFDKTSSRESWASFVYQKKAAVSRDLHAIVRNRALFAEILNYSLPSSVPDYGLIKPTQRVNDYLVFLTNTTWATKHWPESYWQELISHVTQAGYAIKLPWGASHELERAKRLAANNSLVTIVPRLSITEVAAVIANAKAVVALDTGLAHVSAAFNIPTLSLYGPNNPELTGTLGLNQVHLTANFSCAPCLKKRCYYPGDKSIDPPCFSSIPPTKVWDELQKIL